MPIVPSCGDQTTTPNKEKETTRIASTKSDDRKNDKKLKNKNVGSTFKFFNFLPYCTVGFRVILLGIQWLDSQQSLV